MKKFLSSILVIGILICLPLCSGCNSKATTRNDKEIVTSFYPLYVFTKNLTKGLDNVQVKNLTEENTGCMHNYQLLPKDMVALDNASLIVVNGAGLETFVDVVKNQLPDLPVCNTSKGIKLLETRDSLSGKTDKKIYNAHVWMSVKNSIIQVENISKSLIEIMPEQKDKIEKNKKAYIQKLESLNKQIKTELKDCKDIPIMTFHEAYSYFANEYTLNVVDTIESEHGQEPSAKEIARLANEIKEKDVKALFVEPEYKGTSVGVLSNETGVKHYTLSPATSGDKSLSSYEDIMLKNAKTIKEALH